jgi:hypothetical protein
MEAVLVKTQALDLFNVLILYTRRTALIEVGVMSQGDPKACYCCCQHCEGDCPADARGRVVMKKQFWIRMYRVGYIRLTLVSNMDS